MTTALILILVLLIVVMLAVRIGRNLARPDRRSIRHYGQAMNTLESLPDRVQQAPRPRPGEGAEAARQRAAAHRPPGRGAARTLVGRPSAPRRDRDSTRIGGGLGARALPRVGSSAGSGVGIGVDARDRAGAGAGAGAVTGGSAAGRGAAPSRAVSATASASPLLESTGRHTTVVHVEHDPASPLILEEAARIIGVAGYEPERQDPSVEANARLTATTGLLLAVLFFGEGLTIPFIARLLSWHIIIGLLIIPPVLVKMGSTLWKFSHYYLGDERYRRAGPPHPMLRLLGPVLMTSTVVLLASGVALWLAGPSDVAMLRIHQVFFVIWFAAIAVHFLSHFLRAVKLAAADSRDAKTRRPKLMGSRRRRTAVVFSLLIGLGIGLIGRSVVTPWTHYTPPVTQLHAGSSGTGSSGTGSSGTGSSGTGSSGTSSGAHSGTSHPGTTKHTTSPSTPTSPTGHSGT